MAISNIAMNKLVYDDITVSGDRNTILKGYASSFDDGRIHFGYLLIPGSNDGAYIGFSKKMIWFPSSGIVIARPDYVQEIM